MIETFPSPPSIGSIPGFDTRVEISIADKASDAAAEDNEVEVEVEVLDDEDEEDDDNDDDDDEDADDEDEEGCRQSEVIVQLMAYALNSSKARWVGVWRV